MDDAQGIVLLALQRAGVALPDDVHSVGDLRPEHLLPIYSHALTLLRGSPVPGLPSQFPQQRTERFRVCADLVAAFQQLGYRGELSFHQFLYPSEADTHRLLRFLLDQLSHTTSATGRARNAARRGRTGRIGVDDFGGPKISGTVRHALSVCWEEANLSGSVGFGKENFQRVDSSLVGGKVFGLADGEEKLKVLGIPFRTCPLRLSSVRGANKKHPPLVTLQAKPRSTLVPSILELNSRIWEKQSRLADAQLAHLARQADKTLLPRAVSKHKIISHGVLLPNKEAVRVHGRLDSSPAGQEVEIALSANADEQIISEGPSVQQQAEISKLEKQLSGLNTQAEKMVGEVATLEMKVVELKKSIKDASEKADLLDRRQVLMEAAINLALDNPGSPEAVVQELEAEVQEGGQRLQALQAEWEAVKTRLEERVAIVDKHAEAKNSEIQNKLKRMREMRQEVKDMTAKLWAREAEEAQLSAEVDKVVKGATRATYVRRITELIRNSKKQDADIARIIHDMRNLQRESNMSQDKLRRLHALVDETVFRDAKRDPVCRQAYRLLSSVHENFQNIVEKVLVMDKVGREISELQAKLEDLEKRPLDTASVEADLEAIIAENRVLERKLAEA